MPEVQLHLYDEGHLHYFTFRSLERMLIDLCGYSRTERLAYASIPQLPSRFASGLARVSPALFGDVCLLAYR